MPADWRRTPRTTLLSGDSISGDGRRPRFHDDLIEGKVVLIHFTFARSAVACPLKTARRRQGQKGLGSQIGHNSRLYAFSIDPSTPPKG
ncbi:hypothetical protein D9M70_545410 [compost metagenome]